MMKSMKLVTKDIKKPEYIPCSCMPVLAHKNIYFYHIEYLINAIRIPWTSADDRLILNFTWKNKRRSIF